MKTLQWHADSNAASRLNLKCHDSLYIRAKLTARQYNFNQLGSYSGVPRKQF